MKISIIIICDRIRERQLQRLLSGIKPQLSPFDAEIVLIHEAAFSQTLPPLPVKVRYIPIPEKQGIPFNRNQGIKQTQGDIIIFIDDDCWVQERWLASLVQPLLKDTTVLAVTGGTKVPRSNFLGDCIAALGFPGGGSIGFEKMWKVSPAGFTNHLSVGNCALRRNLFEQVGTFDESMRLGAEDTEFSFRLEKAGIPIKYVPEAFAFHEARTSWSSFIRWQLRRGRANYHFQKKVGKVGEFVKLRMWSAGNILKANVNYRLPVIIFLLGLSALIQQLGYLQERWNHG